MRVADLASALLALAASPSGSVALAALGLTTGAGADLLTGGLGADHVLEVGGVEDARREHHDRGVGGERRVVGRQQRHRSTHRYRHHSTPEPVANTASQHSSASHPPPATPTRPRPCSSVCSKP